MHPSLLTHLFAIDIDIPSYIHSLVSTTSIDHIDSTPLLHKVVCLAPSYSKRNLYPSQASLASLHLPL